MQYTSARQNPQREKGKRLFHTVINCSSVTYSNKTSRKKNSTDKLIVR